MPFQVYFSDTSDELDKLRPVLVEQIQNTGMTCVWLDDAEKQSPDWRAIAKQKIAASDAFITVVTYKRGWEPPDARGQSLAEIEYHLAQEAHKPTAVLLPKENSPMGVALRTRAIMQSPADHDAQYRFWKTVEKAGTVRHFSDEADLSRQVGQILQNWFAQQATTEFTPQRAETFLPTDTTTDWNAIIDQIATKTAEKVQALQQKQQSELAEQALKYNEALRLKPGELVFGTPSDGKQFQADIFMVMPFLPALDSVYRSVITPLAKELKLTIVRGDEFTSSRGIIIDEVWSALNQCRFVIVDISGGNDNVFYELGIAHTLNKPAILITQATQPEDVPFDVRHLRYVQYANDASGLLKLGADLKTAITRLLADLEQEWGSPKP
jgi:hypothetical protein